MLRSATIETVGYNGAILVCGAATAFVLAGALGPYGKGVVTAAVLWPSLLVYIFSTGLGPAALFHISRDRNRPGDAIGTLLLLGVGQAIAASLAGFLVLPVVLGGQPREIVGLSRLCLLCILPSIWDIYCASSLQAHLRFRYYNIIRSTLPASYLASVVILLAAGRMSARNVLVAFVVLNFLSAAVSTVVMRRCGLFEGFSFRPQIARRLLTYGLRAQVGDISTLANFRLDQVLIVAWLPADQLGLYAVAVSLAQPLWIVGTAIRAINQPRITAQGDAANRARLFRRSLRLYSFAVIVVGLCLAAVIPVAVPSILGRQFRGSIVPAEITLVAMAIFGYKDLFVMMAQAEGDPWLASRYDLFGLAVTAVALPVLLRTHGIVGAAVASAIAYLAQLMAMVIGMRQSMMDQSVAVEPTG